MIRSSARPVRLALAGLVASVIVGLAPATAGAATQTVTMDPANFKPANASVARGGQVRWVNTSPLDHDVKSTAPSGYFSSGKTGGLSTDESYAFTFRSAGRFSYICRFHKEYDMKGTVTVPLKVVKLSGPVRFKVTVASRSATSPWRHVVQVKKPGASSYVTIATTSAATVTWTPVKHGTYVFRSQVRNANTGAVSGWSPTASATF